MRAIKIDVENQSVSEVEISDDGGTRLSELQGVVGGYIEKAFELDNNDTVFVNEEGLFGSPKFFFEINGGFQPYAGNAVVIGYNPKTGDSVSAQSSVSEIKALIKFLTIEQVRAKYDID